MNYEIKGGTLPVVLVYLDAGEKIMCEKGAMAWMTPNMKMETSVGGFGKAFSKMLTGESIFQNTYTAEGGSGMIAFASGLPGSIMAIDCSAGDFMVQKGGYLASQSSVQLSIGFQKKIGAGFFGGEGFIMQRLSGNGIAFIEIDGSVIEYELQAGQSMVVDTGYIAAVSGSCTIDIQTVKGVGNALFGGEGLFNTVVTGPGKLYLQTMPLSNLASVIAPYCVSN